MKEEKEKKIRKKATEKLDSQFYTTRKIQMLFKTNKFSGAISKDE